MFQPRAFRFVWPCALLIGCGETPVPEPRIALSDSDTAHPAPIDILPAADTLALDSTRSSPAAAPNPAPRPEADEGCVEHIDASPAGVRVVHYAAKDAMKAREEALEGTLASAWMMAEQGASVSIADDFERGIATEHTDMPDTLDVTITYYARCSSRSPHTVRAYRVWRTAGNGYDWRER